MINTVDDFMKRFSSGGTIDDQLAAQMHDRFVSTKAEDSQFDNRAYHEAAAQYIGKLPDDQFRNAARNAVTQAPPEQRQDLLGGLLGALKGGSAGGLGNIASMLGLSSTDPNQMSEDDATKVMNYARRENPDALRQTVQEKPWFVKAMGNPVVIGALTMAATKLRQPNVRPWDPRKFDLIYTEFINQSPFAIHFGSPDFYSRYRSRYKTLTKRFCSLAPAAPVDVLDIGGGH